MHIHKSSDYKLSEVNIIYLIIKDHMIEMKNDLQQENKNLKNIWIRSAF